MTKKYPRLIQEFLVPALDSGTYGENLKWIDKEEGLFCLRWNHKNSAQWNEEDAAVFVDWDKLKGHYKPTENAYFMKAKQRFRSALYKLDIVEEIPCDQKNKRLYKLHLDEDRSKPRKPVERLTYPKERATRRKNKVPVKKESVEDYISEDSVSNNSDFNGSQNSISSSGSESIYWNNGLSSSKRTLDLCPEEPNPAKVRKVQTTTTTPCPSTILKESTRTNIVYARPQTPIQTEDECKKSVLSVEEEEEEVEEEEEEEEEEGPYMYMFRRSPVEVDRFANMPIPFIQEDIQPVHESPEVFVTSIF